jgi:hypothetical protein
LVYYSNDTKDEANHTHYGEDAFSTGDTPPSAVKKYDVTTNNNEPHRHDNIRNLHFFRAPFEFNLQISVH